MRGVTAARRHIGNILFISTHTPHARRDVHLTRTESLTIISTHTPHARRDAVRRHIADGVDHFYSHASCEA